MTELLVIRHGQSEWNAAGRWQGRADPPLTELGRAQARAAADALPDFDHLATSTLERARLTAAEIAGVVGIEFEDVTVHEGLVERDAGEFSGLTREQIDAKFPGYLENRIWPDGWEHQGPLVARVRAALDIVVRQNSGGTVVVVAHGGVIYALEGLFGLPHERIGNLGGRWFTWDDGDLDIGDRIHLLDEAEETVPDQL